MCAQVSSSTGYCDYLQSARRTGQAWFFNDRHYSAHYWHLPLAYSYSRILSMSSSTPSFDFLGHRFLIYQMLFHFDRSKATAAMTSLWPDCWSCERAGCRIWCRKADQYLYLSALSVSMLQHNRCQKLNQTIGKDKKIVREEKSCSYLKRSIAAILTAIG